MNVVSVGSSPKPAQIIDAGVHSGEWVPCSLHQAEEPMPPAILCGQLLTSAAPAELIRDPERRHKCLLNGGECFQALTVLLSSLTTLSKAPEHFTCLNISCSKVVVK